MELTFDWCPDCGSGSGYGYNYGDGGYGDGGYGYNYGDGGYGDGGYGYGDGGSGDGGYGSGDGGYGDGGYGGSGDSGHGYNYGAGGYGDGGYGGSGDGGYGSGSGRCDYGYAALSQTFAAPGIIALWKSTSEGLPANGGSLCEPAAIGQVVTADGPLSLCTAGTLHATWHPSKWKGCRLWVVALHGDVVIGEHKIGCLRREILAELQ